MTLFPWLLHRRSFIASLLLIALSLGCEADEPLPPPAEQSLAKPGALVLAERGLDVLDGQRVGLIVNHTAMVDTTHLIDIIAEAPNVELVALFGPEHGLRGTADAGEKVDDGVDDRTGVPIFSLYGANRKPSPESLSGLDVVVFDIQDIGARFYTYISTMGLAMQAAAESGIRFVVLDRPNPLGGLRVDGFVLEPEQTSFVGQFPIPIQHGMTVGELAQMIKGEAMLPGLETLDLHVVPADGWSRGDLWEATGLPWIPPSPNIPDMETALVYPGACFFEATDASEGRGTLAPFLQVGAPWANGDSLATELNRRGLAGVRFEAASFTPESIEGMASSPKLEAVPLQGIRYVITDAEAFRPVLAGLHVLDVFRTQAGAEPFITRPNWLARLAGTERLGTYLGEDMQPEEIAETWREEVDQFVERRQPYLLYD